MRAAWGWGVRTGDVAVDTASAQVQQRKAQC